MEPTVAGRPRTEVHGGALRVDGSGSAALEIGAVPRVVGRNEQCDLVLADEKVSAVHMEVVATSDGVRVRDLGSRNGTFLGAHRIVEAYLSEEATLACGDTRLSFSPSKPEQVPMSRAKAFGPMVGRSPQMRALFERLRILAKADLTLLVLGETGTGKELVAQAIHHASPRAHEPFVVVDCGAIPPSLAESILFGHERGAFTGAVARRLSPFVEAKAGTIFLDELGELPLETQPKLLRALAERRVKSVGASAYTTIEARVVCATRRDLLQEVNAGTFRSDLYFRVAQARIELPPLRERPEDIPALVEHMMEDMGAPDAYERVTVESIDRTQRHDWPGNVRELRNLVGLALAFDDGGPIDLGAHFASASAQAAGPMSPASPRGRTFAQAKQELEGAYFRALYAECGGNVSEVARRADVDRKTVRECLRRHRIGR
jgi:DNA-binding NtrC family response regulator